MPCSLKKGHEGNCSKDTCPKCGSNNPAVRGKGPSWAVSLYNRCTIRCDDEKCRYIVPHWHEPCPNPWQDRERAAPPVQPQAVPSPSEATESESPEFVKGDRV